MVKQQRRLLENKKMGKKKIYTKAQFLRIICKTCNLCKGGDCSFCYDEIYINIGPVFRTECIPELRKIRKKVNSFTYVTKIPEISDFYKIFCNPAVCGACAIKNKPCKHALNCFHTFLNQNSDFKDILYGYKDDTYCYNLKNNNRCNNIRVVSSKKATPLFFYSKNPEWENTIKNIIEKIKTNVTSDIKQNTDSRSPQ